MPFRGSRVTPLTTLMARAKQELRQARREKEQVEPEARGQLEEVQAELRTAQSQRTKAVRDLTYSRANVGKLDTELAAVRRQLEATLKSAASVPSRAEVVCSKGLVVSISQMTLGVALYSFYHTVPNCCPTTASYCPTPAGYSCPRGSDQHSNHCHSRHRPVSHHIHMLCILHPQGICIKWQGVRPFGGCILTITPSTYPLPHQFIRVKACCQWLPRCHCLFWSPGRLKWLWIQQPTHQHQ